LEIAVVAWVGIDQASDRSVLIGHLGFDPAPASSITGDDDLAFDIDFELGQFLVVGGDSIIDVDQVGGYVSVGGISVIGGKLPGLTGIRVFGNRGLFELGLELDRLDKLDQPLLWSREQHIKILDMRIQAPRLELAQDELGVLPVVIRANVMRLG